MSRGDGVPWPFQTSWRLLDGADPSLLRSERNLTKYTRRETDAGQKNKNKKTQAGDWNSVAGDRVRVGPRAVVKLPYVVQGNDVLRWEFCVRAHDVRFSVSERRMASGGAVEVGLLPSATFAAGSKFGGAWTAETATTLLLVFDNAYSLVTAKDVAVAVSVRSATYRPAEESLSAMAEYRKEWRELHTDSKV